MTTRTVYGVWKTNNKEYEDEVCELLFVIADKDKAEECRDRLVIWLMELRATGLPVPPPWEWLNYSVETAKEDIRRWELEKIVDPSARIIFITPVTELSC